MNALRANSIVYRKKNVRIPAKRNDGSDGNTGRYDERTNMNENGFPLRRARYAIEIKCQTKWKRFLRRSNLKKMVRVSKNPDIEKPSLNKKF